MVLEYRTGAGRAAGPISSQLGVKIVPQGSPELPVPGQLSVRKREIPIPWNNPPSTFPGRCAGAGLAKSRASEQVSSCQH